MKCQECGAEEMIPDPRGMVCQSCGLVNEELFSEYKPSKAHIDFTLPINNSVHQIGFLNERKTSAHRKLHQLHFRHSWTTWDRINHRAFNEFRRLSDLHVAIDAYQLCTIFTKVWKQIVPRSPYRNPVRLARLIYYFGCYSRNIRLDREEFLAGVPVKILHLIGQAFGMNANRMMLREAELQNRMTKICERFQISPSIIPGALKYARKLNLRMKTNAGISLLVALYRRGCDAVKPYLMADYLGISSSTIYVDFNRACAQFNIDREGRKGISKPATISTVEPCVLVATSPIASGIPTPPPSIAIKPKKSPDLGAIAIARPVLAQNPINREVPNFGIRIGLRPRSPQERKRRCCIGSKNGIFSPWTMIYREIGCDFARCSAFTREFLLANLAFAGIGPPSAGLSGVGGSPSIMGGYG
jgi:hypothetical protein